MRASESLFRNQGDLCAASLDLAEVAWLRIRRWQRSKAFHQRPGCKSERVTVYACATLSLDRQSIYDDMGCDYGKSLQGVVEVSGSQFSSTDNNATSQNQ
eukprot:2709021-Amphidinium_carterae.2